MRSGGANDRLDQAEPAADSKVHILILSSVFPPVVGGAGAVAEALGCCLPDHISVVTSIPAGSSLSARKWRDFDQRFPFPVYRLRSLYTKIRLNAPPRLRGALQFAYNYLCVRPLLLRRIVRILRQRPTQVICVNTVEVGYWLPKLVQRFRPQLKVIFYLHGEELSDGQRPTRHTRLVLRSLVHADALITVSTYTQRLVIAQGVPRAKVCVLNNGVDADKFSPGPRDAALQARFGLEGRRVLLCLARFDERKGQDMLIRAMPAILDALPDSVLLLVGSGDGEPNLRELVEHLGLRRSVLFAGVASDEEVVRYYRTADVYAMPNRTTERGDTEGFGLVFLEAGACAKPVIGGRAGGVPDAIIDGQTGYLVDGQEVGAIAESCIRLLGQPELAAQMGRAGLEHARQNSWKQQSARFLQFCESVIHDEPMGYVSDASERSSPGGQANETRGLELRVAGSPAHESSARASLANPPLAQEV